MTLSLVDPLGREPGSDDEAEDVDVEDLVPLGLELERIHAEATAAEWDRRYAQALEDIVTHSGGAATATRLAPLFTPATALLTMELPKTDWLIRGLMTASSVAVAGAEPKAVKTWAGIEMLLAIATGSKAFGQFPAPARRHVAAFLVEDDAASFRNRLFALMRGRSMGKVAAAEALSRIHFRCMTALDLTRLEDCAHLVASMRSLPEEPACVMVDPLRNVIGATDENDSAEMAKVTNHARAIRNATGASLLIIHHSGKAGADSRGRRGGQKLRGSSVLHGAVDCGFYMGDTHGNMETNWKNRVEVEIKRARGAGVFGLELDVVDEPGDDGAAHTAGWAYYRNVEDMDPPEVDDTVKPPGQALSRHKRAA